MQDILAPRDGQPRDNTDTLPTHGRSGHGAASIVPHLYRQQMINDKPPAVEHWEQRAGMQGGGDKKQAP